MNKWGKYALPGLLLLAAMVLCAVALSVRSTEAASPASPQVGQAAQADAGQPLQFEPVSRTQVNGHRWGQVGWNVADERTRWIEHVRWKVDTAGTSDIDHLLHRILNEGRNFRIVPQIADRPAGERTQATRRDQHNELLPARALDFVR